MPLDEGYDPKVAQEGVLISLFLRGGGFLRAPNNLQSGGKPIRPWAVAGWPKREMRQTPTAHGPSVAAAAPARPPTCGAPAFRGRGAGPRM